MSISYDASTVNDQQFVCHKSSNLRSNRSDQVYNIQNKHSRYPPRSKNISHSLWMIFHSSSNKWFDHQYTNTQTNTNTQSAVVRIGFLFQCFFSICSSPIFYFDSNRPDASRCHLTSFETNIDTRENSSRRTNLFMPMYLEENEINKCLSDTSICIAEGSRLKMISVE